MTRLNVAILGATGAVGQKLLEVLDERDFPVAELRLLATSRSAGAEVEFRGRTYRVESVVPESFEGVDIAFFAASTEASRTFAPEAVKRGAIVVDKSNAFRMDPAVPLVVPEVNPEAIHGHAGILASPNCSTSQLVVALKPLHDAARLQRVIVSSYQSVSGTGRDAMEELEEQVRGYVAGAEPPPRVYPHPIAFNVVPQCDSTWDGEYSLEEVKFVRESRKILGLPDLAVTATAVRVPVTVGHCESVLIETERKLTPDEARDILRRAPGVIVIDDPARNAYPTPRDVQDRDEVFVGRIREDHSGERGLWLWIVADNLRKGAATNAVQIAELAVARLEGARR